VQSEVTNDKQIVVVSPGNLKNNHLYVPTNGRFLSAGMLRSVAQGDKRQRTLDRS
jgi:hypothetical protein